MKKCICVFLTCIFLLLFSACSHNRNQYVIPQLGNKGGFELQTSQLSCKSLVSDGRKYIFCSLAAGGQVIEYYADGSELCIVYTIGDTTYYYSASITEPAVYRHPMADTMDMLRELQFSAAGEETLDGKTYLVYHGEETITNAVEQQIDYTKYTIQMDWPNVGTCLFHYYIYSDGATLISAEAPAEINPLLTPDTAWSIDADIRHLTNAATNERIPLVIIETTTGKALSPNGGHSATEEHTIHYYIYTDPETGAFERFQQNDGAAITLLYDVQISKPVITDEMAEMDERMLQTVFALLDTVESLF